jgi:hypothetical protein
VSSALTLRPGEIFKQCLPPWHCVQGASSLLRLVMPPFSWLLTGLFIAVLMSLLSPRDPRLDLGLVNSNHTGSRMDDTQALLDMINSPACDCDVHSRGCWGFFVVRTSFEDGDDERVPEAMDRLETYCKMRIRLTRQDKPSIPFAIEIDVDAVRRHHNTLINDLALKDASIQQVRSYLSTWFEPIPGERGGPRFMSVILLDKEVLGNLVGLPKNPNS